MNKSVFALMVVFWCTVPARVLACEAPTPPDMPDVETAVLAEMVKAQNQVKKFIAAGNEYLECEKDDDLHNQMVDLMHDVGEDFNKVIKDFKAKNKS